jgi:hypothetical protein
VEYPREPSTEDRTTKYVADDMALLLRLILHVGEVRK